MDHNWMQDTKSIYCSGLSYDTFLNIFCSFNYHFHHNSTRRNAQNVPERSTFRYMCLRDNLTDHAHCGGLNSPPLPSSWWLKADLLYQPQRVLFAPQHSQFSFSFTSSSKVSSVFSDLSAFSSSSLLSLYTCAMNYSPIICCGKHSLLGPFILLYTCTVKQLIFTNPVVDNLNQCLLYQLLRDPTYCQ
jgi:hypothetical protein